MTTLADTRATTTQTKSAAPYRLTFAHVIRSEWIKLRSLRSTWAMLVSTLVALIGFGAIAAAVAGGKTALGPPTAGASDPVGTVLTGANFAVVLVGVFGAVVGSREFASGLIRTTLAAVPKRLPVLWAKVIAFTVPVILVAVTGVVAAFSIGMAILASHGHPSLTWSDPGVTRAVLGTAAYIAGVGVIGLALGVLIRATAGAIGLLVTVVLILPTLATALLPKAWDSALKYLPTNAAAGFTSRLSSPDHPDPAIGAVVFALWVALALAGAVLALGARDV